MDLTTLLLIEVTFVEFLIILILLVILYKRKPEIKSLKKERKYSVREVEKEANAIASVGRRLNIK